MPSDGADSEPMFRVKNTFIHFDSDDAFTVADGIQKRPSSLPPPRRCSRSLDFKTNTKDSGSEDDASTNCADDDVSSVSGGSERGSNAEDPQLGEASPPPTPPPLDPSTRRRKKDMKPLAAPPATGMFEQAIEALVSIVQATLVCCMWVESLQIKNDGIAGWSIIVCLPSQNFQHKDEILALAKESLTQVIGTVANVCMTGYGTRSFVTTPRGFDLTVAGISNKRQACRGMLQTGFCIRGDRCHWEHPVDQRKIRVEVMVC